jgi:hypothetical protein
VAGQESCPIRKVDILGWFGQYRIMPGEIKGHHFIIRAALSTPTGEKSIPHQLLV